MNCVCQEARKTKTKTETRKSGKGRSDTLNFFKSLCHRIGYTLFVNLKMNEWIFGPKMWQFNVNFQSLLNFTFCSFDAHYLFIQLEGVWNCLSLSAFHLFHFIDDQKCECVRVCVCVCVCITVQWIINMQLENWKFQIWTNSIHVCVCKIYYHVRRSHMRSSHNSLSHSQKLNHIYYYEMTKTTRQNRTEETRYKLCVLPINHFARSLTKELTHPQFIFDNNNKKFNQFQEHNSKSESMSKRNGFHLVLLIRTYFAFAKWAIWMEWNDVCVCVSVGRGYDNVMG